MWCCNAVIQLRIVFSRDVSLRLCVYSDDKMLQVGLWRISSSPICCFTLTGKLLLVRYLLNYLFGCDNIEVTEFTVLTDITFHTIKWRHDGSAVWFSLIICFDTECVRYAFLNMLGPDLRNSLGRTYESSWVGKMLRKENDLQRMLSKLRK